jgi:hypothetical protein
MIRPGRHPRHPPVPGQPPAPAADQQRHAPLSGPAGRSHPSRPQTATEQPLPGPPSWSPEWSAGPCPENRYDQSYRRSTVVTSNALRISLDRLMSCSASLLRSRRLAHYLDRHEQQKLKPGSYAAGPPAGAPCQSRSLASCAHLGRSDRAGLAPMSGLSHQKRAPYILPDQDVRPYPAQARWRIVRGGNPAGHCQKCMDRVGQALHGWVDSAAGGG